MEFAEQVKSSVDIVNVVGEYVRLRKAGVRYVGLCPFHTEKTPSFGVNASAQFYKCFGCGAGGDVFKFVMEIERVTFWEAVKLLAEKHGIPLPKRSEFADEETRRRARLLDMQEIAARNFAENLSGPSGGEARAYLQRRGVTGDVARLFQLGLSDRGGQTLTRLFERSGFTGDEMETSGLVLRRQDGSGFFDRFRGRLMFPIHNESGKTIAFGGRALLAGDEPKYLNSSDTPLYHKQQVLYNLHRARESVRKHARIVLVEGYMDVIGVTAGGVGEVVATCGTALTAFQVRAMRRHADQIVVNFDPDAAGANATEKSIQVLLEEQMRVKVLQLEGGLDPDEYVKERGAEAYRDALGRARSYFHWLADRARSRFDFRAPEDRVKGFQFLLPAIQRMPDKLERLSVANDMASYLNIEAGMVLDEFRKAAAERREVRAQRMQPPGLHPNERILLLAMITNAEAREQILPMLRGLKTVERFRTRAIFEAIFRMTEAHAHVTFAALDARLENEDQTLLHSLIFTDEGNEESVTMEQALDCLRTLAQAERRVHRDDIRAAIRQAEREGRVQDALGLMQELMALEREE
jgi:DNA primase